MSRSKKQESRGQQNKSRLVFRQDDREKARRDDCEQVQSRDPSAPIERKRRQHRGDHVQHQRGAMASTLRISAEGSHDPIKPRYIQPSGGDNKVLVEHEGKVEDRDCDEPQPQSLDITPRHEAKAYCKQERPAGQQVFRPTIDWSNGNRFATTAMKMPAM